MSAKTAIELLAPARNFDTGKAAIDNGADAVYIAGPYFGAREAAGNTLEDVERMANYAHQFYAKTYLTLNTILYEKELETARQLIVNAWNAGIDAIIIQDMALLEMDLPPVPLFASTQTNNATPEKIKFLQNVGFERIILARELSLNEITAIRKATTVDLEFFIHGALCVSYSGQCYLSQALSGRSANRGACAQPCRAIYDLLDSDNQTIIRNKHLLSLRDLNLTNHLKALIDAGISSFKIEGRLKNESYVKNVVAHYRKKIDALLDGNKKHTKASCGKTLHFFTPNVERSFSRGFTNYFFEGRNAKMFSHDTGKAIGQEVGKIIQTGNNWFIYSGKPLHNADGICFFDNRGNLRGTNVNQITQNKIFVQNGEGLTVGATVYRNFDYLFEQELKQVSRRSLSAEIFFIADEKNIQITAKDESGITVSLILAQCGEIAKNEETAIKNITTQLEKSGNTIFDFSVIEINCTPIYFYPVSLLNQWRRDLTELLLAAREKQRKKNLSNHSPNDIPYPEKKVDYSANIANSLARKFYERHCATIVSEAFEISPTDTAQLMRTKYCIKYAIGACQKQGGKEKIKEPLYLLNNGKKLRLTFDCKNCQMIISEHL